MKKHSPLLSIGNDPKTVKGEKYNVLTAIQYLSPASSSGFNICPYATESCIEMCLNTAGRGGMQMVQDGRMKRTRLYVDDRDAYHEQLHKEIHAFVNKAKKKGMKPAIRLNGTSDILWERTPTLKMFPDVQFYDYTKVPVKYRANRPDNYHLTLSVHEKTTDEEIFAALYGEHKMSIAVVFKNIPETFFGKPVINGDESDLRFNDPVGSVIGLKAKGKARYDTSGFVR